MSVLGLKKLWWWWWRGTTELAFFLLLLKTLLTIYFLPFSYRIKKQPKI